MLNSFFLYGKRSVSVTEIDEQTFLEMLHSGD